MRRPSSKNLLRRHSSDSETSLSSVSSDSDLGPRDESKGGTPSRKKKNSSPRRRQHRAQSDQEDLTDNSTASAPNPKQKEKAESSPSKTDATAGEKKASNVKTPAEMCKLFGISNTSVFDGGNLN